MTRQPILLVLLGLIPWSMQAQTPPRVDVAVHGTILANGFRNSARVNNEDDPTMAILGQPGGAVGGSIRQTRLRLEARADSVLGGQLFAELDTDFFGGQQPSSGGRTHPLFRIRRAYGELRWSGVSVLVGQEAPPLFGLNPSSVAASGIPLFAASGNLWLWLPQARVTGWIDRGGVRLGLEATVLAPSAGQAQDPFFTQPDAAEASDRPAFEGRLIGRWGSGRQQGEIGIGGHRGWLRHPDGSLVASKALGGSAVVPLGALLEIRTELFVGDAVAGLGGGGVGQNIGPVGGVSTRGGWGQLVVFPTSTLELGAGFGIDDPDNGEVEQTASARLDNRTAAINLTWRPAPLVLGFEVRRLSTRFSGAASRAESTHLNLALGVEF